MQQKKDFFKLLNCRTFVGTRSVLEKGPLWRGPSALHPRRTILLLCTGSTAHNDRRKGTNMMNYLSKIALSDRIIFNLRRMYCFDLPRYPRTLSEKPGSYEELWTSQSSRRPKKVLNCVFWFSMSRTNNNIVRPPCNPQSRLHLFALCFREAVLDNDIPHPDIHPYNEYAGLRESASLRPAD